MTVFFIGFIFLIFALLALDLGVFHKNNTIMSAKAALLWTMFWISLALIFNIFIFWSYGNHIFGIGKELGLPTTGQEAAIAFFTAFLIEKSLSIDNIFVIAMVFAYFKIPAQYQHRVLFWGILGALFMRGMMICFGVVAISRFGWLVYVLGALLIITAIRMMFASHDHLEPEKNILVRAIGHFIPLTKEIHGAKFFVKINSEWRVTPLFLSLILIESTDLLFAVDSIPAVLAITLDPFLVFTSNVFAILGMRSLYFALASMINKFRYLKHSLILILGFVGIKMLITHYIKIDALVSLGIIVGVLLIGVVTSVLAKSNQRFYN
jgi:tellurite resistance protein TerC